MAPRHASKQKNRKTNNADQQKRQMQWAESQSSPSCLQIGVGLMSHVISWIDRVPLQQHLESRETSQQAVAEGREEEEGVDVVGLERSWKGGSNP